MALPQRRTPRTGPAGAVEAHAGGTDWHTLFQIQNPADVDRFVAEHPGLVPILRRASAEIIARFGSDVELRLEHTVDPEDEPPSEILELDIRSGLDHDEAYARRNRLDNEWWFDAIREVAGLLIIDLALQ
jgi:hypothetical protein